jgi:hypothetical protein
LVVGFLSFARAIVVLPTSPPHTQSKFEIGMALGLTSIGLHVGAILVGIRAGALCIRRTVLKEDVEGAREDEYVGSFLQDLKAKHFFRYLRYCERLQLLGSLFFVATLMYMPFLMFSVRAWRWVLLGTAIIGLATLLLAGVWRMSVFRETCQILGRKRHLSQSSAGSQEKGQV